MKIVFPYIPNIDYAGGSEYGGTVNVARLFELLGHDIYCGRTALDEVGEADILFLHDRIDMLSDSSAWNSYKDRAKLILLGVFNPLASDYLRNVPEKCVLVTPYRTCGTECMVLPYAYYHERPHPGFSRKTIGWTLRNAFDIAAGSVSVTLFIHLEHLRICKQLVDAGCSLILFSNNTYPQDISGLPGVVQEAHGILDSLRNHVRVTVVEHQAYRQYLYLLGQTSIVIPLNGLGSTTEALKLGSVPLSWTSEVNIYSSLPTAKPYTSVTHEDIYVRLSRLVSDEDFFHAEYNALLNNAAVYDINTALNMVTAVINRMTL